MNIIKAGLLGAIISASLMIASSLPNTQAAIARAVFSNRFLAPSSENLVASFTLGIPMRGWSLIGVSILSGAFLNSIWPLVFLLRTDQTLGVIWKIVLAAATVSIPVAVVMSYSRGAIFGLLMVVIITLLFNSSKVRQPVILGAGIAILMFSWVGWNSKYFKFDWLQTKTISQLENPYTSVDTTARLYSYTGPFQHLVENPRFLFFGDGFARKKVSGNYLAAGLVEANHAVFSAAYYGYGMIAAIAYILLLMNAFRITWGGIWRSKNTFSSSFSRALLAGLFGFSSWFILGHAAVSQPRGAMLLFFVFGLVAAQQNFAPAANVVPASAPSSIRQFEALRNSRL